MIRWVLLAIYGVLAFAAFYTHVFIPERLPRGKLLQVVGMGVLAGIVLVSLIVISPVGWISAIVLGVWTVIDTTWKVVQPSSKPRPGWIDWTFTVFQAGVVALLFTERGRDLFGAA